jgi:hypothetical protein
MILVAPPLCAGRTARVNKIKWDWLAGFASPRPTGHGKYPRSQVHPEAATALPDAGPDLKKLHAGPENI